MTHKLPATLLALALALVGLNGCDDGDDPKSDATPSSSASATATPTPAKAAPAPKPGSCYRMSWQDAVATTTDAKPNKCQSQHTTETFFVGDLDTVVDGHLVAVDSDRVQEQVAADCPSRLSTFVGGTEEDLRLSMLSAVWFSPTVEESDEGQNWFRCDVVSVGASEKLDLLAGPMKGVLGTEQGRETYGMCGTDEPGTKGFKRVSCSHQHTWRAISTVDVAPGKGGAWPGEEAAKDAGATTCEDAARSRAEDPLKFTWSYEWPTKKQWSAGHHYGYCWEPTA